MGGRDGFSRGTIVISLGRACKLLFSITTALLPKGKLSGRYLNFITPILLSTFTLKNYPADFYCQNLLEAVHKMHNVGGNMVDPVTAALTGIELVTTMID